MPENQERTVSQNIERNLLDGGYEPDFHALVSKRFQRRIRRNSHLENQIYNCIQLLTETRENWINLKVKKPKGAPATSPVRIARVEADLWLIFAAPFTSVRSSKPFLLVHDFCDHDQLSRRLKDIIGRNIGRNEDDVDPYYFKAADFHVPDFNPDNFGEYDEQIFFDEMTDEQIQGMEETSIDEIYQNELAFALVIPVMYLLEPEKINDILNSTQANIRLTEKQFNILYKNLPLLIHGEAGSGKTTILCHRLALTILRHRWFGADTSRILYLSYNPRLVEQAKEVVQEILQTLYDEDTDVSDCEFMSFADFLRRYVPETSKFDDREMHVTFGRFKEIYRHFGRHNNANIGSAEFAWHVIRGILKGSGIPINDEMWENDFIRRHEEIEVQPLAKIRHVFNLYQGELGEQLWDDQDLAREALNSIPENQYSEIFFDEAQDLTRLEFEILLKLCRPPAQGYGEGIGIVLAGAPMQTINPTGFRWSRVRECIYQVEGRPVPLHILQENWRSDHRIVALANEIQEIRSVYLEEDFIPQEAFKKDGDYPRIVTLQEDDDETILQALEDYLNLTNSAVILWDEEEQAITKSLTDDSILKKLSQDLDSITLDRKKAHFNLYTVSDAKGLEFEFVILYKVGGHPEVEQWWESIQPEQVEALKKGRAAMQEQLIPLLYFLNRLYVSITRAQSYLFIVDTPEAIEGFWKQWIGAQPKTIIHPQSATEFRQLIEQHVAFELKHWERQGEEQFERAEDTKEILDYERALVSYNQALYYYDEQEKTEAAKTAERKATKTKARIAELNKEWKVAAELYKKIEEYDQAIQYYERAQEWEAAGKVYLTIERYKDATNCFQRARAIKSPFDSIPLLNPRSSNDYLIYFSIKFSLSTQTVSISHELKVTLKLQPLESTLEQTKDLWISILTDKIKGSELNLILHAPGFQYLQAPVASLPFMEPARYSAPQQATFRLMALRPGKSQIRVALYRGDDYETEIRREVEVVGSSKSMTFCDPLALLPRSVALPDYILQVHTRWNETGVFHYHLINTDVSLKRVSEN